jgi:peptidoglycan/xylan/chitin deacetylase (PgdA/CDA1 family)
MKDERGHKDNWSWPGGAHVAVSLTFDVDAESPYLGMGDTYTRLLSTMSDARFGITRGMPRVLALLREHSVPATFFVPGETARLHPKIVEEILSQGHEIAHHGDFHKAVHTIPEQEQLEEIVSGIAKLEAAGAPRPRGYRSPSFEMTPETFTLLCANGFSYDSSMMGDDRPYIASYGGHDLIELPVTWTLDDWPLVGFSAHYPHAKLSSPDVLFSTWLSEFREAKLERRHVSFTMHPEVIGRSSRFAALRRLVETILADGQVWMAKMEDVAMHAAAVLAERAKAHG